LIDRSGNTIAALNVSTNSNRTSLHMVKATILPLLLDAAATIRKELEMLREEGSAPAMAEAKREHAKRSSSLLAWR
jgi:hypothetical protein